MDGDPELNQLRERVSRLEAIVASLQQAQRAPVEEQPPALPASPAIPPPPAPPEPVQIPAARNPPPRPEVSSTVWIAGAGGVIFLLGAIFALTVSIQRGWISPPVRVAMGIATGIALGAGAARLMLGTSRRLGIAVLVAGLGTFVFALHYGAASARLFSPNLGLAGTVAATLFAGGLASRVRSGGAMAVAVTLATLAPLIFSSRRNAMIGLMSYLLAVVGAQAAACHLGRTGAGWRTARWLGLVPIALLGVMAAASAEAPDRPTVLLLVLGAHLASLWVVWLPAHPERPAHPVPLTCALSLALTLALYTGWRHLGWTHELFALPLLAQAGGTVALMLFARGRLADRSADFGLVLLAAIYLLLAVPVAIDSHWLTAIWGAMALAAGFRALAARRAGSPDASALWVAGLIGAVAASARWLAILRDGGSADWIPFLNPDFVGVLLASGAWGLLAAAQAGTLRNYSVAALEIVVVNAIALEWMDRRPVSDWTHFDARVVLATLTYAVAGAGQWYAGMRAGTRPAGRGLRVAGYVWMAVAALKLLGTDLAGAPTEWRAVAALAVGEMLLAVALLANRIRRAGSP